VSDPQGPLGFDDGDGEKRPSPPPRPLHPDQLPDKRRPKSPSWVIGVVALIALTLITINTFRNRGEGPGAKGPEVGAKARAFTGPLATGKLEGTVNVATGPDQGDAGKIAACDLHLRGAFNLCDQWVKGPVAVALFIAPQDECVEQLRTLQTALSRHPQVSAVAVAIRGDRDDAAKIARGLRIPVVYDEDGRVANLYGMAVCPHITYLRRGGRVAGTNIGIADLARVDAQLRALETGAPVDVG